MEKRRVVITGAGALTPIGRNAPESWAAARAGVCGVSPITLYDAGGQKVRLAAEVKHFVPEDCIDKRDVRKLDRFAQFALAAAAEAMTASGLNAEREDPARCGVLVSSGIGGLSTLEREIQKGAEKGFERISPFYIPMTITNLAAGHIAIRYGFQGMCACPAAACAGGSNAVGDAFRHIRDGYAEVMLCGGAEAAITPSGIGGFTSMHALTLCPDPERASIPFDAERSGFVMGEGAGILLLEELSHAQRRGADILAEVVGYGATCDAHHITAPAPGGAGAAACMRAALADAGIAPEQVGYLNAHGTSTPLNDACETAAIKAAFGPHARRLAISSTKSMTGHLLGASGAVEALFTALALRDGFLPPTIHYQKPDPACDLDVVPNAGRAAGVEYAMSNSLGFGGHNVSLLLRRWEGCAWN
ncbi:beta-ketoacyl-ACP synthase II [Lawsonibacter sp.]|uniref:beta-ketoacyl-ACP synthase II n=1 Tax=Lawsonibacter sp. TaxID=2185275 RepID=UPI002587B83D|nr:beta-ketoacyl-ACP synthase II [Lawsonibacter sp.]MCI6399956.1 beta-ketoacyl-ACP synthase II [Lawsonibacter sp.]MDY2976680.1 beta-ketoacyl-ACP synthase II [Oscillospiraceae bacterium]